MLTSWENTAAHLPEVPFNRRAWLSHMHEGPGHPHSELTGAGLASSQKSVLGASRVGNSKNSSKTLRLGRTEQEEA